MAKKRNMSGMYIIATHPQRKRAWGKSRSSDIGPLRETWNDKAALSTPPVCCFKNTQKSSGDISFLSNRWHDSLYA
jgi:hypothetical protein